MYSYTEEQMMKRLRYLIFLMFNLAYQDGKNDRVDPYSYSILFILFFEFLTILFGRYFLDQFVGFDILNILEYLCGTGRGFVIALVALLFLPTYYFFIKKKRFDCYYNEFKDDPINTKRNRTIGYTCLILYMPILLVFRVFQVKYWS